MLQPTRSPNNAAVIHPQKSTTKSRSPPKSSKIHYLLQWEPELCAMKRRCFPKALLKIGYLMLVTVFTYALECNPEKSEQPPASETKKSNSENHSRNVTILSAAQRRRLPTKIYFKVIFSNIRASVTTKLCINRSGRKCCNFSLG